MIQGSLNADFVVVTDVSSSDKIHPTVQTVADDKVETRPFLQKNVPLKVPSIQSNIWIGDPWASTF